MTQRTGRPVGRPKTKEYTTLLARVPQDLVDRVKTYARLHRQAISELIRDGLEWRIEEDVRPAVSGLHSGNTALEALEHQEANDTPVEHSSNTPKEHPEETRENSRNTATERASHPVRQETPPFDTSKYRLGKLCRRGHDYHGTGQSLLRIANGGCLECNNEDARTRREAKRQTADIPAPAGEKAGLIKLIHRWHEAEQLGPQALADRLNAQQVPTLSGRGQWQKGTVAKLLQKAQP